MMAEKYYIINPTQHALQIYDIVRILPGTEEEPTVTECTITNDADLEAVYNTEGWGLKVLSQTEYAEIMADAEDDEDEEKTAPVVETTKVRVSNQKNKAKQKTVEPEIEVSRPEDTPLNPELTA